MSERVSQVDRRLQWKKNIQANATKNMLFIQIIFTHLENVV